MSDWISVKDRLPDEDGVYQIRCIHWRFGTPTRKTLTSERFEDGAFDLSEAEDNYEEYREITHWMPLPEAPQ